MEAEQKTEKKQGYLRWAWSGIKYYTQTSYYLAFVYGKMRSLMQPYISTEFNVQEIEQGVFIGDIASAFNVDELKRLRITHVVTAILGVAPQFPKDFVYMTVPIRDVESEDIKSHLPKTTQFIDDAVSSGGKVLIHCVCGISRSATIVAAWVMSKHGYTVEETLQILKTRRECVDPNPAFRDQLEQYSKTGYVKI
jgi:protein-tyrosine phosphatase